MKNLLSLGAPMAERMKKNLEDFFFVQASTPLGFLQIIFWLRFAIFLILIINFRLGFPGSSTDTWVKALLIGYGAFALLLLWIMYFRPTEFVSRQVQLLQIGVDSSVIMMLYIRAQDPESDLFLLLFLPVLVLARFFDLQFVTFFMCVVAVVTIVSGVAWTEQAELFSLQYWFRNLLPRFGFLFILSFFYLIYYRRRGMEEHLKNSAASLVDSLNQLWMGNFTIDRSLHILWADEQVRSRHKIPEEKASCINVFCKRMSMTGSACDQCPIVAAFRQQDGSREYRTTFVDREGITYSAGLEISLSRDSEGNPVQASVRVQDLDRLKDYEGHLFSYADNFERVSDQRRSEELAQWDAITRRLKSLTAALETLPSSDLEQAVRDVILSATSQLNAQVVILSKPALDVKSGQMGLQISFQWGLSAADAHDMPFVPLDSNSLAVKAFTRGEFQFVEDVTNSSHPYYLEVLRRNNLRAQACFPLKTEGQSLGVISWFRKRAGGFSFEELKMGQAFANVIALMIASRDAMSETTHQAEERRRLLGTLEKLGFSLTAGGRPQELAQQIADFICQTLHVETAAIFLQDGHKLHRVAISKLEANWYAEESYHIGEGLTGQAVLPQNGKPYGKTLYVNDVPHEAAALPRFIENYSRRLASKKVQHLMAVPLNGQGGTFGVLRILNKLTEGGEVDPAGFTRQDVETLEAVANSVGILLENSRQLLKQRILTEVAQSFIASLSYEKVLQNSLEQAVQLLKAELGFILLWGEETNGLTFRVTTGAGASRLQQQALPRGHGMAYEVLETGEPQLVSDTAGDDRFESWLYQRTGLHIRSLLSVPLRLPDGRLTGVLELASQQPDTFNLSDASLLGDLTPWIGIAISNALRYQTQTQRAEFLSRLQGCVHRIGSAGDKKLTMDSVARSASELMNCEIAGVALYDERHHEIYALPDAGYVGAPPEYVREFRFSIDRPGGQVLREGKVRTCEDASRQSSTIFGRRLVDPLGARGIIAAPLLEDSLSEESRIIGVLYAASRRARRWTEDDQTFFSILAKHSAMAIRNAELRDRRERRAQLLNLIHEVSIAGQMTDDINLILNIILTAITAEYGLRFNRALLMLYDKHNGVLRGITGIGQLEDQEARRIWENLDHEEHNMKTYVREVLKKKSVPYYTTLHYKASNLVIPVNSGSTEVLSRVLRTHQPEIVDAQQSDVIIHPDFFNLMQPGVFLVTPLIVKDQVLGVLVVDNKFNQLPIEELERELLDACASQAAAAIQRSELHRRLKQQVDALDRLQQVVGSFSELASPQEALRRIAQAAKDLLRADTSQLIPYQAQQGKMLIEEAVGVGFPATFKHKSQISEHGLTRLVLNETSDMLVVENLDSRSDLNSRTASELGIKSVVGCRLEFAGEIIGVLYVNYLVQHRFDKPELDILRTLARHAAVAIHNSRLMEENRSLAAQAERSRLREDLHDILGKLQFKISAEAESIYEKLKKRDRLLAAQAEELWLYARHIYVQLERIMEDMVDTTLPESGLPEALRNLLAEVRIPLESISVQGESRASPEVELMFYRICQEAVVNIIKHAGLPENKRGLVEISLEQRPDYTRLVVQDRGRGFSQELLQDRRKSIGLASMQARAKKINASICISSKPGEGVYIEVRAPRRLKEKS